MSVESPLISIVVPAFNELGTIETLIGRLQNALVGLRYEIVIVDDCSTDGTSDLIRKLSGGPFGPFATATIKVKAQRCGQDSSMLPGTSSLFKTPIWNTTRRTSRVCCS